MSRASLRSPVLRSVLEQELATGNAISDTETGWSKMALVVRMARPLDQGRAWQAVQGDPACHVFENRDPHNGPPEFGIVCCNEAVTGPAPG